MSEAVECRQEIDLRLGAAFTRFQTTRIRDRIDGWDASGSSSVISYGPCQFPTLGFVVDRHLQREHFVSENYWYLQCTIEGGDPDSASGKLSCSFKWRRGVVYDRYFCVLALDMCLDSGAVEVTGNVSRPSHRYKPVPLSTIELQKRASTLLRISSSHATMEAAEALYMRGIISYPRTETDSFPEGFHYLL
jgi:DNA topoisomerase-3